MGQSKPPLSDRRRQFVELWLKLGNADEAARQTVPPFKLSGVPKLLKDTAILAYKAKLEERKLTISALRLANIDSKLAAIVEAIPVEMPSAEGVRAIDLAYKRLAGYPGESGMTEGARRLADGSTEVYRSRWMTAAPQPALPTGESGE